MPSPSSIDEFKRFAAGGSVTTTQKPWPEFPRIPEQVKSKFPDLALHFEAWEKAIDIWVREVQNTGN